MEKIITTKPSLRIVKFDVSFTLFFIILSLVLVLLFKKPIFYGFAIFAIIYAVSRLPADTRALVSHFANTLIITPQEITFIESFLRTKTTTIAVKNIRAIDLDQSVFQKMLDIGDLKIGSAATAGWEIIAPNIENVFEVQYVIRKFIYENSVGESEEQ